MQYQKTNKNCSSLYNTPSAERNVCRTFPFDVPLKRESTKWRSLTPSRRRAGMEMFKSIFNALRCNKFQLYFWSCVILNICTEYQTLQKYARLFTNRKLLIVPQSKPFRLFPGSISDLCKQKTLDILVLMLRTTYNRKI